jgi:hypothetical protein
MNFIFSNKKEMGLNPASIDLDTGIVTINRDIWGKFSPVQKDLILLHEKAHYLFQNTDDEILCDKWALEQYAKRKNASLKKAIDAFNDLLNKPYISFERREQILLTCLTIDAEKFGNKRAAILLVEYKKSKGRRANAVDAIAGAITSVASFFISLGNSFLWGKKNDWAKEKGTSRTPQRETILKNFIRKVIGLEMQRFVNMGYKSQDLLGKIESYCKNYTQVSKDCFVQMSLDRYFDDGNVATYSWGSGNYTYEKFISSQYYSWFPGAVKEYANATYQEIYEAIQNQMNGSSGAASGLLNNIPKWVIYAVAGIVGIVVIKRIAA